MPEQHVQPPGKLARRWKRTAAAAVLLLVGGAIVNVAVAWGLAAYGPMFVPTEFEWFDPVPAWNDSELRWWRAHYPFDVPAVPTRPPRSAPFEAAEETDELKYAHVTPVERDRMQKVSVRGCDIFFASGSSVKSGTPSIASVKRCRWGLPLRSMMYADWNLDMPLPNRRNEEINAYGLTINVDRDNELWREFTFILGERRLPLRPVWPGFIINTLFYALLLWLLLFAPFAARRMLRRRRGLCEKCAYPIGTWGGSPVCTECGAAVR